MFRPHLFLLPLFIILACWQDSQAMTPIFTVKLWNSPIPVKLDEKMDEAEKANIRFTLQLISNNTCIDFEENLPGPQLEFVWGQDGPCKSDVGDVRRNNNQAVNIPSKGCPYLHEISHALGFRHTLQRPDRDLYVTIHRDNIHDDDWYSENYEKVDKTVNTTDYGIPYEYSSFMHYLPNLAIPNKGLAFDPKNPKMELIDYDYMDSAFTKQHGVIFNDWKVVNMHYKCHEKCSVQITCHNGGYQHPRICTECVCPQFAVGKNCETEADTSTLKAGETYYFNHGFPWNEDTYRGVAHCDNMFCAEERPDYTQLQRIPPRLIKGPEGSRIRVTIKKFYDEEVKKHVSCTTGCSDKGVEIVDGDLTRVGKMFCCHKTNPHSFLSETNVVGVSMFAIAGLDFTANVTFTAEMPA